ncbi:MAG: hypothetical protein Q9181_005943 [Wetmoreana brouardii]
MPRPTIIHLVLDFDGTLTRSCTLPLIYRIGRELNPSSPPWHTISEAYAHDYQSHESAYAPSALKRTSIREELTWLESLRDVEQKSMERVEATGVFRGVGANDVRKGAEQSVRRGEVLPRKGWARVVEKVVGGKGMVGVVSVGWSAEFIRACLSAAVAQSQIVMSNMHVGAVDVRANEIVGGETGELDRYFEEVGRGGEGGVWTARDKRKAMQETAESLGTGKSLVVYVGDSTTDFECLLAADVGICVKDEDEVTGEQKGLEQMLKRIGIRSRWIGDMGPDDMAARPGESDWPGAKTLWWTRDFDEICDSPLLSATVNTRNNDIYSIVGRAVRPASPKPPTLQSDL